MKNKYYIKIYTLFLLIVLIVTFSIIPIKANEKFVYLGGDSIGIHISNGIEITGLHKVETNEGKVSPWKNSDIEIGDQIKTINGIEVNNLKELDYELNKLNGQTQIGLIRNNQSIITKIKIVNDKFGHKSIGLYMKDSISGIGTLTFVYNDTFASLAHSVDEKSVVSNKPIGTIYESKVYGVRKATEELVGEKKAGMTKNQIGVIYKNTDYGVYGKISNYKGLKMKISNATDVQKGKAKLYTVVSSNIITSYDIEIIKLISQKTKGVKGIKFKVIDEKLIEDCGGIIQGMSGSPIVQNDKLIGGVSHVISGSPLYGYALYAEWMLEEAS